MVSLKQRNVVLARIFANRVDRESIAGMPVAAHTRSMADFTHYLNDCKFILVSNREPYEHILGMHGV
jgi:hypothetical protein